MAVNVVLGFLFPFGDEDGHLNVTQLLGQNAVQFSQKTYNLTVSETATPGPLLQLTVKVRTKEIKLTFDIISGDEKGLFHVNNTGVFSLVGSLDYETAKKHLLVVRASFNDDSSEAGVSVIVRDENDNVPLFHRKRYETQITEEDDRHLPKTILNVSASDDDIGMFGIVTYKLSSAKPLSALRDIFAINTITGEISLLKSLDRDPPLGRSRWEFDVIATDGQFESSATVVVNVKDVNDNEPFFPEKIVVASVLENCPEGTPVTTVMAIDHDDPTEGTNARIFYSLQKNVVEESTGRPIFVVDGASGRLLTALCCLDRERTDTYAVQLVATDGGGLKGTGTVLVKVSDENDVPPKFTRNEWHLSLNEELRPNRLLATLSVIDPDITNDFQYRIVSDSGRGWDLFYLSKGNNTGSHLYSKIRLDYENPNHRQGFRFQIQVSDMGVNGWQDKYHIDSAWVNVRLGDINDNGPQFLKEAHYRRVPEDIPLGTPLVTVRAIDADGGGSRNLEYTIDPRSDTDHLFTVDRSGAIRLQKPLDREVAASHRLLILATDDGEPARTATATLVVDVVDVNDNPPFFNCPTMVTINEGSRPRVVANLTLDDPDDWEKGHGPPFSLYLDPKAPSYIKEAVQVDFSKEGNGGAGLGTIRTITRLDREEREFLAVPIVVVDGADEETRQSTTLTFTVALRDVNDHLMKPATKTVVARLLQPALPSLISGLAKERSAVKVPVGRIFVLDPDEGDSEDKRFRWGVPSPFFVMDPHDGTVSMEPWTPPGTYFLKFLVSDLRQGQMNVSANITVEVKSLSARDLMAAVPLDIQADAERLIQHKKIEILLGAAILHIGTTNCPEIDHCTSGCWVKPEVRDGYALVDAQSSSVVGPDLFLASGCGCHPPDKPQDLTSSVEPRPVVKATGDGICDGKICLNGGKCVPQLGVFRCICPHGTVGPRCKLPERYFYGDSNAINNHNDAFTADGTRLFEELHSKGSSWAWLPTLPSCSQVHVSFQFLTSRTNAVLLFSGDIMSHSSQTLKSKNVRSNRVYTRIKRASRNRQTKENTPKEGETSERGNQIRGIEYHTLKDDVILSLRDNDASERTVYKNSSAIFRNHQLHKLDLQKELKKTINLHVRKSIYKRFRDTEVFRKIRHRKTNQQKNIKRGTRLDSVPNVQPMSFRGIPYTDHNLTATRLSKDVDLMFPFNDHDKLSPSLVKTNTKVENGVAKQILKNKTTENKSWKLRRKKSLGISPADSNDFLLLRLKDGRPHLLLNLGGGVISLSLSTTSSLSDHVWHRIDIIWKDQLLEMIVDLCLGGSLDLISDPLHPSMPSPTPPDALHCRVAAPLPEGGRMFNLGGPIQIGGVSSNVKRTFWTPHVAKRLSGDGLSDKDMQSFRGCIKNFRVNGELQDLGYGLLSSRSVPGCLSMDCTEVYRKCSDRGMCVGSPGKERCECLPGWIGEQCQDRTVPAAFGDHSFVTLALSFTPHSSSTDLQLRLKTREENGELISLSSPHGKDRLALILQGGNLCLRMRLHPQLPSILCLSKIKLNDGDWHWTKAFRVGSAVTLMADDGDGDRYNASLLLDGRPSLPLSRQNGLRIGGEPQFSHGRITRVASDFQRGCIDDVRLQGRPLPLPPANNGTRWGQVTRFRHVTSDCQSSGACLNMSCSFPLSCIDTWQLYHCGCEEGSSLSPDGKLCLDIDECLWQPCLNDGLCQNYLPGYTCSCSPGFSGAHCHVREDRRIGASPPVLLMLGAALSAFLFVLILICGLVLYWKRRRRRKTSVEKAKSKVELDLDHQSNIIELRPRQTELSTFQFSSTDANRKTTTFETPNRNIAGVDVLKVDLGDIETSNIRCSEDIFEGVSESPRNQRSKRKRNTSDNLDVINTYKEN